MRSRAELTVDSLNNLIDKAIYYMPNMDMLQLERILLFAELELQTRLERGNTNDYQD